MLPVREAESGEGQYHANLETIRQRILSYVRRRMVPQHADFSDAEDIAQSCVVVLFEHYPQKRDLAEMTAIAVGTARHKIAQFRRDREKTPELADMEPHSTERLFEHIAARESMDRLLRALLKLPVRCRELLRLKLIEQRDYAEMRMILGISGNIYEMTKRCHKSLLRIVGGGVQ
jgi:RNA polymerase sigma factor (sigma-70 family)